MSEREAAPPPVDLRSASDAASDAAMHFVLTAEMHDMARGLL